MRCEDVDAENRPFPIGCQPELLQALTRSAWVFFRLDFKSHAGLLMVMAMGNFSRRDVALPR